MSEGRNNTEVSDCLQLSTSTDYQKPRSPFEYRSTIISIRPTVHAVTSHTDYLQIYTQVRIMGLPNYLLARVPIPSGLIISNWRSLLKDYADTQLLDFLEFGWPSYFTGALPPIPAYKNHTESIDNSKWISKLIET